MWPCATATGAPSLRGWRTERIDVADSSFRITYEVAHQQNEIDFAWRGQIIGESDGTIRFTMEGQARTTFERNRIGFCVLHPPICAGAACRIEHVDGAVEASAFPRDIAPQHVVDGKVHPHYPFAEMRALAHEVTPGVWAEVRFDGEIFELEDQRNWIDGSYKTYGTPQRLPQPATITAGTQLRQSVTLTLRAENPDLIVAEQARAARVERSALVGILRRPVALQWPGAAAHRPGRRPAMASRSTPALSSGCGAAPGAPARRSAALRCDLHRAPPSRRPTKRARSIPRSKSRCSYPMPPSLSSCARRSIGSLRRSPPG